MDPNANGFGPQQPRYPWGPLNGHYPSQTHSHSQAMAPTGYVPSAYAYASFHAYPNINPKHAVHSAQGDSSHTQSHTHYVHSAAQRHRTLHEQEEKKTQRTIETSSTTEDGEVHDSNTDAVPMDIEIDSHSHSTHNNNSPPSHHTHTTPSHQSHHHPPYHSHPYPHSQQQQQQSLGDRRSRFHPCQPHTPATDDAASHRSSKAWSKHTILPPAFTLHNRYRIHKCIGKGRFSHVFSAEDVLQKHQVAVKVDTNPKEKELLQQEYEIMNSFAPHSPYVCRAFDFGRLPKEVGVGNFLVMELCDEQNLSDQRKERACKCFGVQTGALIGVEMVLALQCFHARGWVHRDIKPSNFVVPKKKHWPHHLYIVDFGLSKAFDAAAHTQHEAEFIGTSLYASVTAHRKLDLSPVDDLWSVLFVVIDISTNSLPWKEDYIKLENQSRLRRQTVGHLKEQFVQRMLADETSGGDDAPYKMPREYKEFMRKLSEYGFGEAPDYQALIDILKRLALNEDYTRDQFEADHAPEPVERPLHSNFDILQQPLCQQNVLKQCSSPCDEETTCAHGVHPITTTSSASVASAGSSSSTQSPVSRVGDLCAEFILHGRCASNRPTASWCQNGYHWTLNDEMHFRNHNELPAFYVGTDELCTHAVSMTGCSPPACGSPSLVWNGDRIFSKRKAFWSRRDVEEYLQYGVYPTGTDYASDAIVGGDHDDFRRYLNECVAPVFDRMLNETCFEAHDFRDAGAVWDMLRTLNVSQVLQLLHTLRNANANVEAGDSRVRLLLHHLEHAQSIQPPELCRSFLRPCASDRENAVQYPALYQKSRESKFRIEISSSQCHSSNDERAQNMILARLEEFARYIRHRPFGAHVVNLLCSVPSTCAVEILDEMQKKGDRIAVVQNMIHKLIAEKQPPLPLQSSLGTTTTTTTQHASKDRNRHTTATPRPIVSSSSSAAAASESVRLGYLDSIYQHQHSERTISRHHPQQQQQATPQPHHYHHRQQRSHVEQTAVAVAGTAHVHAERLGKFAQTVEKHEPIATAEAAAVETGAVAVQEAQSQSQSHDVPAVDDDESSLMLIPKKKIFATHTAKSTPSTIMKRCVSSGVSHSHSHVKKKRRKKKKSSPTGKRSQRKAAKDKKERKPRSRESEKGKIKTEKIEKLERIRRIRKISKSSAVSEVEKDDDDEMHLHHKTRKNKRKRAVSDSDSSEAADGDERAAGAQEEEEEEDSSDDDDDDDDDSDDDVPIGQVEQEKKGTKRKHGEMDESSADDHRSNRRTKRRKVTKSRTQRRRRRHVVMSEDTSGEEDDDDGDDEEEEEEEEESTPDNSETETERKAWPSFMSNRRTRNQNKISYKEDDDDDDHDEDEDRPTVRSRAQFPTMQQYTQHGADLTQVLSASNIATAAQQYCAANRNCPILRSETDCQALYADIQQTKRKEIERDLGIELVQTYLTKLSEENTTAMAATKTACLKCNKDPHFAEWELLLCDYCPRGAAHCSCHEPMYCAVPATDWACPACVHTIKQQHSEEYRVELTKRLQQSDAEFRTQLHALQLKKERWRARRQTRQRDAVISSTVVSNAVDANRMNAVQQQSLVNIALPSLHTIPTSGISMARAHNLSTSTTAARLALPSFAAFNTAARGGQRGGVASAPNANIINLSAQGLENETLIHSLTAQPLSMSASQAYAHRHHQQHLQQHQQPQQPQQQQMHALPSMTYHNFDTFMARLEHSHTENGNGNPSSTARCNYTNANTDQYGC